MVTLPEDEKPSAALKSSPAPSPLSRLTRWLRLVTCQRRASAEVRQARYEELVAKGQQVPEVKKEDWYERLAWWSEVKTKKGSKVFVIAPRGPSGETDYYINMREFLGFALSKMHKTVIEEEQRYAVVWVQESDHRVGPWMAWRFSESLPESYAKNLEAVHVVHPSWTVRFLRLILWPLASEDFWDYFHSHERIEFLDVALDLRKFRLPKDIVEYDQWLDKQAEELHKQQAMKHSHGAFMGFGNAGAEEERKKLEEQIEEMKRVLEQKGHSMKTD